MPYIDFRVSEGLYHWNLACRGHGSVSTFDLFFCRPKAGTRTASMYEGITSCLTSSG